MAIQNSWQKPLPKGIEESGDIDVRCYDMVEAEQAKVLEELGFAERYSLWFTDYRWRSIKANLGFNYFHFCGNSWR